MELGLNPSRQQPITKFMTEPVDHGKVSSTPYLASTDSTFLRAVLLVFRLLYAFEAPNNSAA